MGISYSPGKEKGRVNMIMRGLPKSQPDHPQRCLSFTCIDATLDTLAGSKWFSTLDLLSGYWQVEIKEDDRPKTAFCTTEGLFQFKVMLGRTFQKHLSNIQAVLHRLREAGLKIKPSKCSFFREKVDYLGHIIE